MKRLHITFLLGIALLIMLASCTKEGVSTSTGDERNFDGLAFSSADGTSGGTGTSGSGTAPPSQAGVLTAGEWNDQDNWDFWKGLWLNTDYLTTKEAWDFNLENRYPLIVKDQFNRPFPNVEASLTDPQGNVIWKGVTDNEGKVELWADIYDYGNNPAEIQLTYNGFNLGNYDANGLIREVNVLQSRGNYFDLDVFFVVDATGSMGDELEFLKTELLDVMSRIEVNNSSLNVRLGATYYRDKGDDYVTKAFPLTTDINSIVNDVKSQSANGGGDYPEAVHSGLESAISHQLWSDDAIARLAFLILDAPPHEDPEVIEVLQNQIRIAAGKGVKIIPIVASGINKETEFLMRSFALATNGTYVFITDDSGVGNSHLEPTVGDFDVEFLNDLIVRLVNEYSIL